MNGQQQRKLLLSAGALGVWAAVLGVSGLWGVAVETWWPPAPELWITPLGFWLFAAAVFLVVWYAGMKKSRVVARATSREAIRQPVFILMLLISLAILVLYTYVPFFSFGDDVKMLKDCGLATILISSLLLAAWTASTGISAEIEGKTTMTLLSKPLNRRQFIIGKYFGILQAILLLMIPLGLCFLALIYYKVGYDARETARQAPAVFQWGQLSWLPFQVPQLTPERWQPTVQIVPGLVLIFFEAAILTAVSVAIATRAPMVVNIVSCLAIYIVGHLAPVLVKVSAQSTVLEIVQFIARMISIVLPTLAWFDTKAAVATDVIVPELYVRWSAAYCLLYSTAAILLAFALFEDRDLA